MISQRFGNNWLAVAAGLGAATLGLLMLIGGFGLGLAVLSSPQRMSQILTAFVLSVVGLANLWSSSKIWHASRRGLLLSGIATTGLIVYLSVGLRDFGEPLWAHSVYLLLLLTLRYQVAKNPSLAA